VHRATHQTRSVIACPNAATCLAVGSVLVDQSLAIRPLTASVDASEIAFGSRSQVRAESKRSTRVLPGIEPALATLSDERLTRFSTLDIGRSYRW